MCYPISQGTYPLFLTWIEKDGTNLKLIFKPISKGINFSDTLKIYGGWRSYYILNKNIKYHYVVFPKYILLPPSRFIFCSLICFTLGFQTQMMEEAMTEWKIPDGEWGRQGAIAYLGGIVASKF